MHIVDSKPTPASHTAPDALRSVAERAFKHGHQEGWTGNQCRRDVQHVDAEKGWSLYVSNGALEKTIATLATPGIRLPRHV